MTLMGARAGPGALKFEGWPTLVAWLQGLCWLGKISCGTILTFPVLSAPLRSLVSNPEYIRGLR